MSFIVSCAVKACSCLARLGYFGTYMSLFACCCLGALLGGKGIDCTCQHLYGLDYAVSLMLRVVGLLANLVAVVCFATSRANFEVHADAAAHGASLILAFL